MAAVSDVEIWRPVIIVAVLYALIFGGFKGRAFVLCAALTLAVSEQIAVGTMKSAVGRKRPKQVEPVRMVQLQKANPKFLTLFKTPRIYRSDMRDREKPGASFPSAHVANNTIIGILCALFFRPWGALYFIFTAAVAWSRIYLGAHWPGDVFASIFMGTGITLLMLALLESLWRRFAPEWKPALYARHPSLLSHRTS